VSTCVYLQERRGHARARVCVCKREREGHARAEKKRISHVLLLTILSHVLLLHGRLSDILYSVCGAIGLQTTSSILNELATNIFQVPKLT